MTLSIRTLNGDGARKFGAFTGANIGRRLGIVLDGRVQSAPVIETAITTTEARITGRFTQQEVTDLSLMLRSGALPASLTYQEQREVGPERSAPTRFARASLRRLRASPLVTLFMFFLPPAFRAERVCLGHAQPDHPAWGSCRIWGRSMTLPGIAGFILTIGMGVDSNVLIFERIREELQNKKSARQAISAGFDRVFVTIVDTHVASLIARRSCSSLERGRFAGSPPRSCSACSPTSLRPCSSPGHCLSCSSPGAARRH